jgi:putative component of membrane protein insertase Oxa1/YidC/SpoIIIJ protein YidD
VTLNTILVGLLDRIVRLPSVPRPLDRFAARLGIGVLRLYQRVLSRHSGVVCLFNPSCSERAIAALRQLGWSDGVAEAHRQVHRCCAEYQLQTGIDGRSVLITADGRRFGHEEINPRIRSSDWDVRTQFIPAGRPQ